MTAQLREIRLIQVPRAPSGDPCVHSNDNALEPGRFGPLHETFGEPAIVRRVKLKKAGSSSEFFRHALERIDRERRSNHRHSASRGRSSSGQIAMAVLRAEPKHSDGSHEDRRGQLYSE